MNIEIDSNYDLNSDSDSSLWDDIMCPVANPFSVNYEKSYTDLCFSKANTSDLEMTSNTFNKIESFFINDLNNLLSLEDKIISDKMPSLIEDKLQFNSPICDSDYWRKLNVGRTPFTEKFRNSPICKPCYNFRTSAVFNTKFKLDDIEDRSESNNTSAVDSRKSMIEYRKDNLMKYINCYLYKKCENEQCQDIDRKLQMKLMFLHFFYLNERSIILRVMDKHDFRRPDLEGDLNDQYISAYNSFHVLPTFCEMTKIDSYAGIKYYRARHRFDSHWYCIKVSSPNSEDIQTFSKSSRLLKNEILMLSRLKHENIIRYFSSWVEYQAIYEQLEYNKFGSLEEAFDFTIDDNIETRVFTLRSSKELVFQIGSALDFMHTIWKFVHNSVTTSNVLLFPVDPKKTDIDKESLFQCLFEKKLSFDILFKLTGFETCELAKENHDFSRDVQDLATIAAESIGEEPICWKYTSPTKSISIKNYSNDDFVLILMDAVLGHVKSAKELLDFVG